MKFSLPFRVYYDDTDAAGVVYHTEYLKYMERARSEALFSLGYSVRILAEKGWQFVVHRMDVQYLKPGVLGQMLCVDSQVVENKKVRMLWRQKVIDAEHGEVYCSANIWVACVNQDFKVTAVPNELYAALQSDAGVF